MGDERKGRQKAWYLLTMPLIISISASAAAIFSADEGCGRPPNMNDMLRVRWYVLPLGRINGYKLVSAKSYPQVFWLFRTAFMTMCAVRDFSENILVLSPSSSILIGLMDRMTLE